MMTTRMSGGGGGESGVGSADDEFEDIDFVLMVTIMLMLMLMVVVMMTIMCRHDDDDAVDVVGSRGSFGGRGVGVDDDGDKNRDAVMIVMQPLCRSDCYMLCAAAMMLAPRPWRPAH